MSAIRETVHIAVRSRTLRLRPQAEAFAFFVSFARKYGEEQAFLLDSVTDFRTQYCTSIIGLFPLVNVRGKGERLTIEGKPEIVNALGLEVEQRIKWDLPLRLDAIMGRFTVDPNLPAYAFGYVGFFGYDAVRYFEELPDTTVDDRGLDDYFLQIHRVVLHFSPEEVVVHIHDLPGLEDFDEREIMSLLAAAAEGEPTFHGYDRHALTVEEDVSFDEYVSRIEKAKEYIRAGDIFQCVISKRNRIIGSIDALQVYGRLRQMNPSPYMFFAHYGSYLIFGASPEMQVRVDGGLAQMKPIAGTSKGKAQTPEENDRLISDLLSDPKERAEHVMLVDLCRNDLGRVAVPGTVKVEKLLQIEEYSHVFHLVSHVTARIRKDVSPFDVFLATFPAGTLSGAPKVRAMEIVDELEDYRRGPYGGVIGMFDCFGNMDTAIVIRTVVHQDGITYLQAGAGIVADSDPALEWKECDHKLGALSATLR